MFAAIRGWFREFEQDKVWLLRAKFATTSRSGNRRVAEFIGDSGQMTGYRRITRHVTQTLRAQLKCRSNSSPLSLSHPPEHRLNRYNHRRVLARTRFAISSARKSAGDNQNQEDEERTGER